VSAPDEQPDDPYIPAEALEAVGQTPKKSEKAMGFWEHLEELRGTLIKSGIVFAIFAAAIAFYIPEFNAALMSPLTDVKAEYPDIVIEIGTQGIMEGLGIIIQICVCGGLALATPFILFFIGQFVAPALTEKEFKAVAPMCFSALALFLAGAAFSFFVLVPSTLRMAIEVNKTLGFAFRWTADSYYSTTLWFVIGVGASFEFPLVIVLLVWLGIMTTEFLRAHRRHAVIAIFVLAAVVTPTQDPINMSIFAAPLYLLYEIAIIVAGRVEKRKRLAEASS
jgi:sec-independent protein translocase protein TatC